MEQPKRGRKGEAPKTVYLPIGIAALPRRGHIHIYNLSDKTVLSTVCNSPESDRCHSHLYDKLKAILKRAGKWPPEMEEREAKD